MSAKPWRHVVASDAILSDDRIYRFMLRRSWVTPAWPEMTVDPLVVIGLNPSTADESLDDPTIRRCMSFAHAWGHGGIVMLNLFACRATDPDELYTALNPEGGDTTMRVIRDETVGRVVLCAWGAHPKALGRDLEVYKAISDTALEVVCLGMTKGGYPRHPLYVRGDTKPVPFVMSAAS